MGSSITIVIVLRLTARFAAALQALHVQLRVALPWSTRRAHGELGSVDSHQRVDYLAEEQTAVWSLPQCTGGTEHLCRLYLTGAYVCNAGGEQQDSEKESELLMRAMREQMGPMKLSFEIPSYTVTGLEVSSVTVTERGGTYRARRWNRSTTQSRSYTFRVH